MNPDQPPITLYGIANCDTVRKARAWLSQQNVPCLFHDLRKQGVSLDTLLHWCAALGWEALLNRRGTTWRALEPSERDAVHDAASAATLMLRHPTLIKRPVVDWQGTLTVGFTPELFQGAHASLRDRA